MKRMQKAAVLVSLTKRLAEKGSWCGETHVQKATYFLQELLRVPCRFVLYKYGPFSFDLRDELTALCADGVFELVPRPAPYGPKIAPSQLGQKLEKLYPKTLGEYRQQLSFVAEKLDEKDASELERLATALFVTLRWPAQTVEQRGQRIRDFKPHVSEESARDSVQRVDKIREEAGAIQHS